MTQPISDHTPLMQQYHDVKSQFPDTLLMFQVGDFYELFFDDAKQASAFLGIALTARGKSKGEPIPLCGVPVHAKDHYVAKLIKGGFKVALCDQLEEAVPGRMVKRGVTHVLTPGTLTDTKLLDAKSASYLFSFYPGETHWALVFGELLTAQLWATIMPASSERSLEAELARFFPDEIIIPASNAGKQLQSTLKKMGYFTTALDEREISQDDAARAWMSQFAGAALSQDLSVIAEAKVEALRCALHYFYVYVQKTQQNSLDQFNTLHLYQSDDFLYLDAATQRNLELLSNSHDGGRTHTLFALLDGAATPMGSRMIRKWLQRPLINKQAIMQRYDAVERLVLDVALSQMLHQLLAGLGDVERIVGRIALRRAQPYDYGALVCCLEIIPSIKTVLMRHADLVLFAVIEKHLGDFAHLSAYLRTALNDDESQPWIIKPGFDRSLDYMRDLVQSGNQKILALELEEQRKTGIDSLKIRFNTVHGYYIEITKANMALVPAHYVRQQTLVGKERYMTPELAQCAHDITQARSQIDEREKQVFEQVKLAVFEQIHALRKLAHGLAHCDAIHGFAKVAYNNGYTRPLLTDGNDIVIHGGRHPIVEQNLQTGFIPNDTVLTDEQALWIVTGPNMGGKSTYLRQVALISVMAQCGSYVPAKKAQLAILDRVFTRIGAGDNLAAGKSTFLVEMEETALICTQATRQSLVILDEVGRGTSTFDGLAIAQAVVEYIHSRVGARCLFATHYHELTLLSERHAGIVNYYAASTRTDHGIVFLYKMSRGVADGSFGIEVAKLAELPPVVIERAREILLTLSPSHPVIQSEPDARGDAYERAIQENQRLKAQLAGTARERAFIARIGGLDLDAVTPKQAFDLLWGIQREISS